LLQLKVLIHIASGLDAALAIMECGASWTVASVKAER
jgi:hypothetical protein